MGALRTLGSPAGRDGLPKGRLRLQKLWLAARQAVSVRRERQSEGSLAAAQARGGAQAAASGAGPAMSSRHGPTATGEAGQDQQGNRCFLLQGKELR